MGYENSNPTGGEKPEKMDLPIQHAAYINEPGNGKALASCRCGWKGKKYTTPERASGQAFRHYRTKVGGETYGALINIPGDAGYVVA